MRDPLPTMPAHYNLRSNSTPGFSQAMRLDEGLDQPWTYVATIDKALTTDLNRTLILTLQLPPERDVVRRLSPDPEPNLRPLQGTRS